MVHTIMDDRERLSLLNLVPEIGSLRLKRLLEAFGSLEALFAADAQRLQQVEDIGPMRAQRLVEWRRHPERLNEEFALVRQMGCSVVTQADAGYPAPLNEIHDPPLALYMNGTWIDEDRIAVAIVGSRRASLYGQQIAERLAYELALRGVTVVSGLARGIDAAAHRGALKANGRTLALLGNGLSEIYPPEHTDLAKAIAAHGALISEYPMRMRPLSQNFPRRNRLISGLSLGVVIVEAATRSGALITADCALEQGREVFAVPGKVDSLTSQGTNRLLKQGARLVTSVEDILEELRLHTLAPGDTGMPDEWEDPHRAEGPTSGRPVAGPGAGREHDELSDMTQEEQRLLAQLHADEPIDVDTLAVQTGLAASTCAAVLLGLELRQRVKQLPGKRFIPWTYK